MEESQAAAGAPAHAALVDEFGARVYSLALIITGSCELAVETTEAVFRQIQTQPDHLRDTGRTSVIRLAHHHAVRRARAQRATSREGAQTGPVQYTSTLLEQLSADEAAALEVTYFQGRTLQQAAQILDQPAPVLVARIRSALGAISRSTTDRPAPTAPLPVPVRQKPCIR